MTPSFESNLLKATGASAFFEKEEIQSLWSGYGKILRLELQGSEYESVILKHVRLPDSSQHPRGWNTDRSHQRKLKSYQVETAWYQTWSQHCDMHCRVPKCFALDAQANELFIALEDLDQAGYPERRTRVSASELQACLTWLAHFHANFMNETPTGLWESGTYWHLETRPDELEALDDTALKNAAATIDQKLKDCPLQTLVHGDAKLANFCFSKNGKEVAAVDFQYVGGGCGMKDVAYFIGSCLDETACEQQETVLLDQYFAALKAALRSKGKGQYCDTIEHGWRPLYPVAWTDFHRFLKGWSPGHWKLHSYSERLAREVVNSIR